MQTGFHSAAVEFSDYVKFVKVNCVQHASFCRRRQMKHFPWVEIYIPEKPNGKFEDKMRERLLKENGKYSVCPYKSDLSYEGIKAALQELKMIPKPSPFENVQNKIVKEFETAMVNSYDASNQKDIVIF